MLLPHKRLIDYVSSSLGVITAIHKQYMKSQFPQCNKNQTITQSFFASTLSPFHSKGLSLCFSQYVIASVFVQAWDKLLFLLRALFYGVSYTCTLVTKIIFSEALVPTSSNASATSPVYV